MFLTQEPDRKNGEIARNYVNRKRAHVHNF